MTKSILGAWANGAVAAGEQAHDVGPFTVNVVCTRQLDATAGDNTYTASAVLSPRRNRASYSARIHARVA